MDAPQSILDGALSQRIAASKTYDSLSINSDAAHLVCPNHGATHNGHAYRSEIAWLGSSERNGIVELSSDTAMGVQVPTIATNIFANSVSTSICQGNETASSFTGFYSNIHDRTTLPRSLRSQYQKFTIPNYIPTETFIRTDKETRSSNDCSSSDNISDDDSGRSDLSTNSRRLCLVRDLGDHEKENAAQMNVDHLEENTGHNNATANQNEKETERGSQVRNMTNTKHGLSNSEQKDDIDEVRRNEFRAGNTVNSNKGPEYEVFSPVLNVNQGKSSLKEKYSTTRKGGERLSLRAGPVLAGICLVFLVLLIIACSLILGLNLLDDNGFAPSPSPAGIRSATPSTPLPLQIQPTPANIIDAKKFFISPTESMQNNSVGTLFEYGGN